MSQSPPPLDALQKWLQAVIMHRGGVAAGVDSEAARQCIGLPLDDLHSIIRPSQQLSSEERLEIYARAYFARLLECLRAEYPILAKALGEELFDQFALAYLERYPSRSYTLGRLGAAFPSFLHETCPIADEQTKMPAFLIDVATFEWNVSEIFDGPGAEHEELLDATQLAGISACTLLDMQLSLIPSLRLLTLNYAVHDYYQALRENRAAAAPAKHQTHLVLFRRYYVVRYHEISSSQHALLAALLEGATLGEALARAAVQYDGSADALTSGLQQWFAQWTSDGLFLAIR